MKCLLNNWKIPLYKILVDESDVQAVSKVIKRGTEWAIGPEIEEFEKLLANYVGCDYCLAFNSGTSALHAALIAAGVKEGNEIIIPSFTFIATSNSVLMVDAIPKFVDIEEETLGLDPSLLESAITKKTKFVMPVHYAGLTCKIQEIATIANDNKIGLIEDAAEALGSKIGKRMAGSFGELSIFSFAGNKIVTSGEGGAITTNSRQLFEKLKLIRSHGRVDKQNYFSSISTPDYVTLGYNWRMSSMTAALAMSQLQKIDKLIKLRRKNAAYLSSRLSKIDNVRIPPEPTGLRHVYQLYSIRLPNAAMRNQLIQFLAKKRIMSKVFFHPIHLTSFYKKMRFTRPDLLKVTETISNQILSLPLYPTMVQKELDYICNAVEEFMNFKKNKIT